MDSVGDGKRRSTQQAHFLDGPLGSKRHPLPIGRERRVGGTLGPGEFAELECVGATGVELEYPTFIYITDHDPRAVLGDRQTPAASDHDVATRKLGARGDLGNFENRTQSGDRPQDCDEGHYSPGENARQRKAGIPPCTNVGHRRRGGRGCPSAGGQLRRRQRIGRVNSEQETGLESRERGGNQDADNDAAEGLRHTLADHQSQDLARLRPPSHAHADLLFALSDRILDDAIDPHERERQRDAGEGPQQDHREARAGYDCTIRCSIGRTSLMVTALPTLRTVLLVRETSATGLPAVLSVRGSNPNTAIDGAAAGRSSAGWTTGGVVPG